MEDTVYVVGHKNPDTDAVCAAIVLAKLQNALGVKAVPIVQGELNDETRFVLERFNVPVPETMTDVAGKRVMLVDHSEKAQAPDGLYADLIEGIVDHHKVGDVQTSKPILYFNLPLGSSCTVLYELHRFYDVDLDAASKGLVLSSILSDTVILKSPTTTTTDRIVAKDLAAELGVDATELGKEQFAAKANFGDKTPEDVLGIDMKAYEMGSRTVAIAQVEVPDTALVLDRKAAFEEAMASARKERGYDAFVFLITDIVREGSEVMVSAEDPSEYAEALGITLVDNAGWSDGLMSRKKQVVPPFESRFA